MRLTHSQGKNPRKRYRHFTEIAFEWGAEEVLLLEFPNYQWHPKFVGERCESRTLLLARLQDDGIDFEECHNYGAGAGMAIYRGAVICSAKGAEFTKLKDWMGLSNSHQVTTKWMRMESIREIHQQIFRFKEI